MTSQTAPTAQAVIEAVRRHLADQHPGGATLDVVAQGVRQDSEWWYVPVRPSLQPARKFEYYEALARVEAALAQTDNLTVLLIPALPDGLSGE